MNNESLTVADTAQAIYDWMQGVKQISNETTYAWASRAGVPTGNLARFEKTVREKDFDNLTYIPSFKVMFALAYAAGVPLPNPNNIKKK